MGIEQASSQQMAVAQNQAMSQNIDQIVKSEFERKTDTDNSSRIDESAIKKALEGKSSDVGTQILAKLAAKLAQTLPTGQILENLNQNFEGMFNAQEEPQNDMLDLRTADYQAGKSTTKQKQNQQQGGSASPLADEGNVKQDVQNSLRQYVGAYSQMLVSGGGEAKKKIEKMENRLMEEKGVSLKDLQGVKVQVANNVRTEVLKQIKHAFLKQVLTKEKTLDGITAKREVAGFIDFAFMNDELGGYDFGGLDGHLQGAVDKMKAETFKELKDFVRDELNEKVMQKAMGKEDKNIEKDIDSLLKLGAKVGLDMQEFVSHIPKMKDDLGLNLIINYEEVPVDANSNMGSGSSDQGRHQYNYSQEEEKEILSDKLRAIYLKQALYGGMRTVLESQFRMIKLKNGLIKLGVSNFDQVEKEGKALAKVKLYEMLKEGFEERATYAKLSGEAWNMTERKIKTVLKNLENLGVKFSRSELDNIRDKANEKMFREAESELTMIETAIEAKGEIPFLTSKRKMVQDILKRNAAESGLQMPQTEVKWSFKEAC
jgi:hypothetical protein